MPMLTEDQLYGKNGHTLVKPLFRETCSPEDSPIFTLGTRSIDGLINLRSLFLDLVRDDPSEYVFALEVFGDWKIWKTISTSYGVVDKVREWRETADVQRKSMAFRSIIEEAKEGKTRLSASKYLIEEPWKGKSKLKEKRQTSDKAFSSVQSDMDRLRDQGFIN